MGVLGALFQTLSIPLKNEYLHKNKVKNPFLKIKEYQVRLIQKIKKIKLKTPFLRTRHFCPILNF
ncbi:hypothetical protein [Helicobacter pylori]|uniref:hypothetical protein n=1 Tax=Helicobacter pylori TaxID=210 RepID=UPI000411864F|nr:hypothetical protein [Helicobacter pylori]